MRAAWIGVFRQKHIEHIVEARAALPADRRIPVRRVGRAGQLDFYADHFAEWPRVNHVGTSQLTYQSLDDAVELTQLVEAARTLDAYVSPERKRRWIDGCFKPDAALLQASFQTIHNIACWCRSAEVQVALYSGDNALWTQAVEGPNGIREQVARGVTSDYLWFEQSLGYNAYVVQALLPCFTNAMRAGRGRRSLRAEMETVENLMLTPAAMRFPDGHLPNPADSNAIHHAPDRELLARAANLFPTAIGLRQLAGEKSWTALLASSNTAPEAAPLPEVTSRNLESTRMAILRHGPWQVFFHYGQLTASHAQAEALNFEAAFGTTDVSHDPGTVGYGSPMSRDYYRAGVCHNVPLVDGAGQEGWDPGKLERFASQSVSASQPRYRTHAEAARRLEVLGDLLRDTESISVTDGTTHALGFMLNLQGKIHFAAPLAADLSFPDSRPAGFRYFRDATRADFRDQAIFTVDCSGTRFRVTLQLPGAFTLWHVSAPDGPPNRREAVYLETRGTAATLTTTFTPLR
ncbi:MAG: heparinase II/III family protein [Verrucomicrobiota bacterium]